MEGPEAVYLRKSKKLAAENWKYIRSGYSAMVRGLCCCNSTRDSRVAEIYFHQSAAFFVIILLICSISLITAHIVSIIITDDAVPRWEENHSERVGAHA